MAEHDDALAAAVAKLGIGQYRRHVFLCTGPTCCTPAAGQAAWDVLKQQVKDAGLSAGPNACFRTKVGCLRVCGDGPLLVVYPEGTWYRGMTADRVPRFVQEHLAEGRPVEAWIFARNALPHDGGE